MEIVQFLNEREVCCQLCEKNCFHSWFVYFAFFVVAETVISGCDMAGM